jgi:hypothetical protein
MTTTFHADLRLSNLWQNAYYYVMGMHELSRIHYGQTNNDDTMCGVRVMTVLLF